tara:strand:- start:3860 stop:4732 length:873 start_codon:yes stop_codon:yes gene_type:complete
MSYIVGIDFGGTKINTILMNEKGKILKKIKVKTGNKRKQTIKKIIKNIDKISLRKQVKGIGIGVPGILDEKRERILNLPNITGWKNINLKKIIENKTGKKVLMENDANCTALAEFLFGHGKKVKNLACLTIGTGLGGGIIINKKIYIGKGNAAEFGHITIEPQGIKCNCGNYGCLEEYISGRGIERIAKKLDLNKNVYEIYKLAKKGDKKALKVYEIVGKYLGIGISNIIMVLDPDLIVMGGGISNSGNILLNPTIKEVKKRVFFKPCPIKLIKLEGDAGAIGAASLFLR